MCSSWVPRREVAGIDKPQPRRRCVEVHHVPGTRRQEEPEETHWNLSLPPPFYPFSLQRAYPVLLLTSREPWSSLGIHRPGWQKEAHSLPPRSVSSAHAYRVREKWYNSQNGSRTRCQPKSVSFQKEVTTDCDGRVGICKQAFHQAKSKSRGS